MSTSQTGPEHLIHMANDIGHFFGGATDSNSAIIGIADHMKHFWTPAMRRKLIAELPTGPSDEALEELPRQALRLLEESHSS
jgi:formate dehydrogenase subunit delta